MIEGNVFQNPNLRLLRLTPLPGRFPLVYHHLYVLLSDEQHESRARM